MQKILITGAFGFWGYNLIKYIHENNKNIIITALYSSEIPLLENLNINVIKYNICDKKNLELLLDNYSTVIHLAGIVQHSYYNIDNMIYTNINGTNNILELIKLINNKYNISCNLIFASTIGTIGCFSNNIMSNENSDYSMRAYKFPYYYSKIICETNIINYSKNNNLNYMILRPPIIYGPNDLKKRATSRIFEIINKKIIFYTSRNIPICDVRDLTKFTYYLILNPKNNKIYNIDGNNISIYEFYKIIENITKTKKIKIFIPYFPIYFVLQFITSFFNIMILDMAFSFWNSKSINNINHFFTIPVEKTIYDTIYDNK